MVGNQAGHHLCVDVAEFLDRYQTTYVEAECLKSADTVLGHVKALKPHSAVRA
jgi:hypothetical protein